ncbi:MAG: GIY-YIG nuclease family protein [Patescibacteria group bacterium]|jgi:excinuclease ABC subunit C
MGQLKDKLKNIPDKPGVYRFLDKQGDILYIGRASSLKKRVAQYFQKNIEARISEMVSIAHDIKYQVTDTILDSVVLEANLIKKYWPKYNVKDKDNRSFIYIVIPKNDFTKPIIVRGTELKKFPSNKTHIFGPYQAQGLLKNALRIIRRVFPYSTCVVSSGRPCFDYQIGLCPGACVDKISKQDYKNNIKNIELLLAGKKKQLMKKLLSENKEQARSLAHLQDVSLITNEDSVLGGVNRIEGYDISHFTGKESYGAMVVFSAGFPDKAEYRLFKIKTAPASDDLRSLEEVLTRRLKHSEWTMPDLMMIDGGKPQIDFVNKYFKANNIKIPIVGISKYSGDKLIFAQKTNKQFKDLATSIKDTLVRVRDEAHRFGLSASRKKRAIKSSL